MNPVPCPAEVTSIAIGWPFLTAEGSALEVVEGAGHFLHLERPDVVNGLVLDFLRG